VFPALVVQLLQRTDTPTFSLPLQGSGQKQLRNSICLTCAPIAGGVLLVDSIYWMEVYYTGPCSTCPTIRQVVLNGISEVVSKLNYQPNLQTPKQGFLCQACSPAFSMPHPSYVSVSGKELSVTCIKNPILVDDVTSDRQQCWFGATCEMPGKY